MGRGGGKNSLWVQALTLAAVPRVEGVCGVSDAVVPP